MLSKLLKYEFKSTARLFLPLYFAVLLFAGINKIMQSVSILGEVNSINIKAILSLITSLAYFALMAGIIVVTLIVVIQRFYKNLLGDEGYLMFTLPVQHWKNILSKLLASMLWYVLSIITAVCSIYIYAGFDVIKSISSVFEFINTYLGYAAYIEIPIIILLFLAYGIVQIYAAIALGHLFSKHKLLASFGMYIVLYSIGQAASSIVVLFTRIAYISLDINTIPTHSQINIIMGATILFTAAFTTGYFILTNFILKKKLNLE